MATLLHPPTSPWHITGPKSQPGGDASLTQQKLGGPCPPLGVRQGTWGDPQAEHLLTGA